HPLNSAGTVGRGLDAWSVFVCVLWVGTASADASRGVVVGDLEGPAGERARAAVVRAVSAQPDAHAVPRSELSAGDERLRALGTWAVVGGTLRRRGRRYRLQLTLRAVGDDAVRSDLTLRARG